MHQFKDPDGYRPVFHDSERTGHADLISALASAQNELEACQRRFNMLREKVQAIMDESGQREAFIISPWSGKRIEVKRLENGLHIEET